LQAAAVSGRHIDPVMLQAIEPATALDSWLSICAEASVLQFQDNQWQFGHDKLREGVLDVLDEGRRGALHQQVALGIEQCYRGDPAQAAALAGHWGAARNMNKEAHYTGLAGEQAATIGASLEATRFLERADALAGQ